jgi:hypothetical protein
VATGACIGASGRDAVAAMAGTELAASCAIEMLNADTNVTCQPLQNFATVKVCTSSSPHPDAAELVSADDQAGVYCYSGRGAGLNDPTGTERDETGSYFPQSPYCHVVVSSGVETIAAKRPTTRSFPRHEVVDHSRLRWLPVDSTVTIANP